MVEINLFWHRRDLRLTDNLGLQAARDRSPRLVGVFCLDPEIMQRDDIAPVRVAYLLGCLPELAESYRKAGGQLLLIQGNPADRLPRLAEALKVSTVFWNEDVEPYSRHRDAAMEQILRHAGIGTIRVWDQLLHSPMEVTTGGKGPYKVFGPFCKKWQALRKSSPAPALKGLLPLTGLEWKAARSAIAELREPTTEAIPSPGSLGMAWSIPLPVQPGEAAARMQMEQFLQQAISDYTVRRNFPAMPGTSKLSPAFKFGVLGIRTAWEAVEKVCSGTLANPLLDGCRTWQQQLCWREFYQHALWHFPQLADGAYRPLWRDFPWENREDLFQAWTAGRTGFPIIDAAMRQLNSIGWMHNRCRMIVANFLTKDLCVDWRWGEKYFLQHLIDGDLAANNGGWQWSASSGMDPKPLRIFNPVLQAQKFDPQADYIRTWIPELRHVDTASLVSAKISPSKSHDYPMPIVAHHRRQLRFQALYTRWKTDFASRES